MKPVWWTGRNAHTHTQICNQMRRKKSSVIKRNKKNRGRDGQVLGNRSLAGRQGGWWNLHSGWIEETFLPCNCTASITGCNLSTCLDFNWKFHDTNSNERYSIKLGSSWLQFINRWIFRWETNRKLAEAGLEANNEKTIATHLQSGLFMNTLDGDVLRPRWCIMMHWLITLSGHMIAVYCNLENDHLSPYSLSL